MTAATQTSESLLPAEKRATSASQKSMGEIANELVDGLGDPYGMTIGEYAKLVSELVARLPQAASAENDFSFLNAGAAPRELSPDEAEFFNSL